MIFSLIAKRVMPLATAISLTLASNVNAQTAIQFSTDTLFRGSSAVLTADALEFLEEYFSKQDCKSYEVVGSSVGVAGDPLLARRASVIQALAERYGAKTKFSQAREIVAGQTRTSGRPLRLFPSDCVLVQTANGAGAGMSPEVAIGLGGGALSLAAIVVLSNSSSSTNSQ